MRYRGHDLHIGEIAVRDLVARYGSPLYVYDAGLIRRQTARVKEAFAAIPLQPFFAMKANDNLAVLRLIREAGFGCDCVSPGEVFLAKHAGFPSERIWFTSSAVSDGDLLSLQDQEIVVNVNSMSDIDRCIRLRIGNPIALRVNPDVGAGHHRDVVTGGLGVKFGIDLVEIEEAASYAASEGLHVVGLHSHIGSGITDVDPLVSAARTLIGLVDLFPELRFVNFGGGIAVPYEPGESDFPIDQYGSRLADAVGVALREKGLTAILEPGRYLVAESGALVTTVTSRRVSSGMEWLGCDTGFNHLARPSKYGSYHHIINATRGSDADLRWNVRKEETPRHEAVVAGNLCESGDVFTRDADGVRARPLVPTQVGDLLAICDAGAYGFSMASHYNARLLPAEVMVDGTDVRLIRRRQTFEELLRGQS